MPLRQVYIDIRAKMCYFIVEKQRWGGSASISVQRVSGRCEDMGNGADGRPGAVFLK